MPIKCGFFEACREGCGEEKSTNRRPSVSASACACGWLLRLGQFRLDHAPSLFQCFHTFPALASPSKLQNLGLCGTDHPLVEVCGQLRQVIVAICLRNRAVDFDRVEHTRLVLSRDNDRLNG